MAKLQVSVAVGDYDRTRPLVDGTVAIDGVAPNFLLLEPEEIFFRAFRNAEFDVCELSLSSFALQTDRGHNPYVGIPVFPSRAFRHTAISVRTDRIRTPADLRGKRVGLPEYQLTACVWARALLQDDFGVTPDQIAWVTGGLEQPGRIEKVPVAVGSNVSIEAAPEGATLSNMLAAGDLDAVISPRIPSCQMRGAPNVDWLFANSVAVASDYFRRTGVFPIMHLVGVRRELAEKQPWLPSTLVKAFEQSKMVAFRKLEDTSATKVMLPFLEEQIRGARELMGENYWPYGFSANRTVLEAFLRHHAAQGLSSGLTPEALFHQSVLGSFKI